MDSNVVVAFLEASNCVHDHELHTGVYSHILDKELYNLRLFGDHTWLCGHLSLHVGLWVSAQVGCHVVLGQTFLSRHNIDRLTYDTLVSIHDPVGDDHKCMQHEQFYTTHSILLPLSLVQGELNVLKSSPVCLFIILFPRVFFNVINSYIVSKDVVGIFFIHVAYSLWSRRLHLHLTYFCKFMVMMRNNNITSDGL